MKKNKDAILLSREELDKMLEERYEKGYSDAMREFSAAKSAEPRTVIGGKRFLYNVIKKEEAKCPNRKNTSST